MAGVLLDRVDGFIDEEKWTRSALSNYTIGQFKELDAILEEAETTGVRQDLKEHCQKALENSKGSLLAQYLAGLLSWQDNQLDDGTMGSLLNLFESQSKWNIVEYLCQKMLETAENKMVLTYLIRAYEHQEKKDLYYTTMEKLAWVDYEDADVTLALAHYFEEQGKNDEALSFYKKTMYRLINRKQLNTIQQVWQKILEYGIENEDVFFSILLKVEKILGKENAVELKRGLYKLMRNTNRVDTCINLLKDILSITPRDMALRKELIECYREKYKNNTRLEECIKISDIKHSFRNIQEAIKLFEKHISLDTGRFVFHRMYGVGRIRGINQDQVQIDFAKKRGHVMGLEMAISSLISLPDEHIWVLKSIMPKDKLKAKIRTDIPWALKMLAKSFGGYVDLKKIKAELSPSGDVAKNMLLTANEWSDFSQKARQIIKTDPNFGNDQEHADVYVLCSIPASYEEKLANNFHSEDNFFKRLNIIQDFVQTADVSSECFSDMLSYFVGYLKLPQIDEHVVASYVLLHKLNQSGINVGVPLERFASFFAKIVHLDQVFTDLESTSCRSAFLTLVKQHIEQWPDVYLSLLPVAPQKNIIDELITLNRQDEVKTALKDVLNHYRNNPQPFFLLVGYLCDRECYQELGISEEEVCLSLLHLVDISLRHIANRKDLVSNKRILRQAMTALSKEDYLLSFINRCSKTEAKRLYSLLKDIKTLDANCCYTAHQALFKRFPNLYAQENERQRDMASKGRSAIIWTTEKSFNEKSALLKHLLEVEIPKNSLEIGEAIKKGDLKENAEYIFGKERQEQLQLEVGRLQKGLESYRVFDIANLDTSMIGFGVTVTLNNLASHKKEVYTFLGPWESNPDENIISYLAPFAEPMIGKKVGETLQFTINERDYHYTVEKIQAAL